jgi:hypothetical protein
MSERFWSRVDKRGPDECWPWTGSRSPRGYGWYYHLGKNHHAHRVAWMLTVGGIAPGLCVCHFCDNPPCCNPSHLWEGTVGQNNKDRAAKGRTVRPERDETAVAYVRGEHHGRAKLTPEDVIAIRNSPGPLMALARKYGVSKRAIVHVRKRQTWGHIDG